MKKLLLIVLMLVCFCCGMRFWIFWFGFNRYGFDLLSHLFVLLCIAWIITTRNRHRLDKRLTQYLLFLCGFIGIVFLSAIVIWINPLGDLAWSQYFKGALAFIGIAGFLAAMFVFVSALSPRYREVLIKVYVAGVISSCLFEFAEVALAYWNGFDLIRFVFGSISYHVSAFESSTPLYYEWGGFFRGNGFCGTNAQATYISTIIPLLILKLVTERKIRWYCFLLIAFGALLLTMSRTGTIATLVGCIVLGVFYFKRLPLAIPIFLLIAFPIYYLYSLNSTEVNELAETRSNVDAGRIAMYADAVQRSVANPWGIGFGQYYVLYTVSSSAAMDQNPHNTWLRWLLELGFHGLMYQLLFFGFILSRLKRVDTMLGRATFCAVCGLMASSCFNENLDEFFAIFFMALFFACAILEHRMPRVSPLRARTRLLAPALDSGIGG